MEKLSFIEIARKRRSVRSFADRPVTDEELVILFEAARIAPSSNNTQPWRFVALRDPKIIAEVAASGAAMLPINKRWLSKAPCIILCFVEPNGLFHKAVNSLLTIDLAAIDGSIAIEHIVLSAAEIGLGTCWIGWFDEKKIRSMIELPKSWKLLSLLAVGWPAEPLEARTPKRKQLSEIAFDGSKDNPFG